MSLTVMNEGNAHCTIRRQFNYEFKWIPENHYAPRTIVEIRVDRFKPFLTWHFGNISMSKGDVIFRWKLYPTPGEVWENDKHTILRATLPYGIKKGEECIIKITVIPPIWAGVNLPLSLWIMDERNNFIAGEKTEPNLEKEENSECIVELKAGVVERLSIYSRPMAEENKVRTCIVPEDRYGNPSEFKKPVKVKLNWDEESLEIDLKGTEIIYLNNKKGIKRAVVSIAMGDLDVSENISNGVREGNKLIVTANPVWEEKSEDYKPGFGEIHWHSEISFDGYRPLEDALLSARDYLNMNFAVPSDHNTKGQDWEDTVKLLDKFNDEELITFYGWENATDRGHENYYFLDANHSLVCGGSAGFEGGYPDRIEGQLSNYSNFFGVPHHTNALAETRRPEDDTPYWQQYPFTNPPKYMRLIEIMQHRGNQETNDYSDSWRGWHQNNGASVQDALKAGYKLGFTGGTDNHCGWPGRAFSEEERPLGADHSLKSVILTGAWMDGNTRKDAYEALYNRHTWAVWDTRAIIYYKLNEALMGDELRVKKGTNLNAYIKLSAEDSLQCLEVISEGKVIWSSSFNKLDIEVNIDLGNAEKSGYFYIRALQRNGGIIYASPVFVEVME